MTDKEIVENLECCTDCNAGHCEECPIRFERYCIELNSQNALELIKRQEEEINNLQKRIVFWREDMDYHPERERAEAIKEFAKQIHKITNHIRDTFEMGMMPYTFATLETIDRKVDDLVKEMVGDE